MRDAFCDLAITCALILYWLYATICSPRYLSKIRALHLPLASRVATWLSPRARKAKSSRKNL